MPSAAKYHLVNKLTKLLRRNKSVLFTWFISYAALLLLSVAAGFYAYSRVYSVISDEVYKSSAVAIKSILKSSDVIVNDINKVNIQLSMNKKVSEVTGIKNRVTTDNLYSMSEACEELNNIQLSNSSFANMYIYIPSIDYVVSSSSFSCAKDFYYTINNNSGAGYENWSDNFSKAISSGKKITYAYKGDGIKENYVAFLQPLPLATKDVNAVSVIMVHEKSFLEILDGENSLKDASYVFLDKNNETLISTFDGSINEKDFELNREEQALTVNGRKMFLMQNESKVTGWRYLLIIPAESRLAVLNSIKKGAVIAFLVYILLGLACIAFLIRYNYMPVKTLINSMTGGLNLSFDKKSSDEYSFVEQTILKTVNENTKMNEILDKQKDVLKYNFLNKLLRGEADYGLADEQGESFGLSFETESFAVMLFYIENLESMLDEEKMSDNERYQLAKFIITNIMGELVNNHNNGFVTEIDGMSAIIINIKDENTEIVNKQLAQSIEYAGKIISDNFNFSFITAVSGLHKSAAGISDAYHEVLSALEYRMFYESGEVIFYDNIKSIKSGSSSESYYYPLEQERLLVNYVGTGDETAALKLLDGIFEVNFSERSLSPALSKCLMFDLTGTVVKALNEIFRGDEKPLIDEAVNELTSIESVSGMKQIFSEIIKKCCDFVKAQGSNHIKQKIINIIEQCYEDQNLNVAMIAYRMKMHPTYISAVFKEQVGEKLLDYIMKYRIQKAIELLRSDGGMSIEEIGNRVGYGNLKTFVRVFKNHEGVTPAKFKEKFI